MNRVDPDEYAEMRDALISELEGRGYSQAELQEIYDKCAKKPVVIPSGGQGPDEKISEAQAMKDYLVTRGIPDEHIVLEGASATTEENLINSKAIIDALDPEAKVAFSTTNYHVFRSGLSARRVKMRAVGMGAETKWYFWPNAAVREFIGLLTAHRQKQGLILGGMVLFYMVLTLVAYR